MIKLHDKTFEMFITNDEINFAVDHMVRQIEDDYHFENTIFIGVLNGSFMFVADFLKKYTHPCEIHFVKMASYDGTTSTGSVNELIGLDVDLKDRTVVILEDIVDTGNTIIKLKKEFKEKGAKRVRIATLFFKPEVYDKDVKIDYVGIHIPNKFIVGYGLDYNQIGRNLPHVYSLI
jgi:hypoxanthine phosphoribosyltransferase